MTRHDFIKQLLLARHSDPKIEFSFLNVYLMSCLRREK